MKNYRRKYTWFSLCGLNCIFCPMYNIEEGCKGCGGEGSHSCHKIRCSIEKQDIEFCFECSEYPCEKYERASEKDSFITYANIFKDTEYIKNNGIDNYKQIVDKKAVLLVKLLKYYNDGRKKSLYCTASNLFDYETLSKALSSIEKLTEESMDIKEKADIASKIIKDMAVQKGISLKLRK